MVACLNLNRHALFPGNRGYSSSAGRRALLQRQSAATLPRAFTGFRRPVADRSARTISRPGLDALGVGAGSGASGSITSSASTNLLPATGSRGRRSLMMVRDVDQHVQHDHAARHRRRPNGPIT
jgi:hypothetical protein